MSSPADILLAKAVALLQQAIEYDRGNDPETALEFYAKSTEIIEPLLVKLADPSLRDLVASKLAGNLSLFVFDASHFSNFSRHASTALCAL